MKQRNKKIPQLNRKQRILLYISTIIFAALSLLDVTLSLFSMPVGVVIYVFAAVTLFAGVFYFILDVKSGMKEEERQKRKETSRFFACIEKSPVRNVNLTVPGVMSNTLFAAFHAVIGIMNQSAWFGSLAAYYMLLSLMRIGVMREEKQMRPLTDMTVRAYREIAVYKRNSIVFVLMAIVLAGIDLLLEFSQGGAHYPGLTIYVAALYAFYKIIRSSIDVVKAGKQKSPLFSIKKRIGYIDACVSILTLQTAMFASFGEAKSRMTIMMNGMTGTAVCLIVLFLGIQGIWLSGKKKREVDLGGK